MIEWLQTEDFAGIPGGYKDSLRLHNLPGTAWLDCSDLIALLWLARASAQSAEKLTIVHGAVEGLRATIATCVSEDDDSPKSTAARCIIEELDKITSTSGGRLPVPKPLPAPPELSGNPHRLEEYQRRYEALREAFGATPGGQPVALLKVGRACLFEYMWLLNTEIERIRSDSALRGVVGLPRLSR